MRMAWEWVPTIGTVVVALAGIGATLRTAAQGRSHAEHLASEEHRRAHQEMLRRERLKVYADALAHAVNQERKLNAVWASDGEHGYDLSPKPPGAPLSLASMDAVTVQMSLLADEEAEQAWGAFVSAWEGLHWWAEVERSGDPGEEAPKELLTTLRLSIDRLKQASRQSIQ
jgi:hypothetical protein